MAGDGTQWYESRRVFVTTTLRNFKIRLTSLPEKAKEPEQREKRLASGGKLQKRNKSSGKEEAESKAGQEPTGAERERMAGAVWTEVWNMQPVRNLREKGGFAALVDSADMASWLRGTRVMGDSCGAENREARKNHGNPGGTVNASGLRTLRHGVGLQDTKRAGVQLLLAEKREDAFFLNSRWHTDKWSRASVVMMSDAGIRDSPSKPGVKQQGIRFLMMHRGNRELLAAAFYEERRAKQDDINILELRAVQAAAGMMMALRAGEAGQFTSTRASVFTRPELRTLKTKVAACTHSWEEGN